MSHWGSKLFIWEQWRQLRLHSPRLARVLVFLPLLVAAPLAALIYYVATDDPGATIGTPQAVVLAKLGHPAAVPADAAEFVALGVDRKQRFRRLLGECPPFVAADAGNRHAEELAAVQGSVLWYDRFPGRSYVYVFDDEQRLSCVIKGSRD
jgi:hypothetical protein